MPQSYCPNPSGKLRFGILVLVIAGSLAMPGFSASFINAESIEELRSEVAAKQAAIKQLEAEAEKYRAEIATSASQAKTLKAELSRIDSTVKQLTYDLSITKAKLDATTLALRELNLKIGDTQADINHRKKQMEEIIRLVAYQDETGLLITLAKAANISEIFDQAAYLMGLQDDLYTNVTAMERLENDLEGDRTETQILQTQYRSLQANLSAQNSIQQNKKLQRSQLLTETQNQEIKFQQLLSENQKKQQAILKEIYDLEFELQKQAQNANIPGRNPGLFLWPVDNGYLTQGYGSTSQTGFINDFYNFHNGIDIGAKTGTGTSIKAAFDGVVSATGDVSPYAYGRWVAIKHSNGLTTLYGHLSLISVSAGASVQKGTVIGYMGSTGYVTGPHLHFTVYATDTFRIEQRWFGRLPVGGSVNPFNYVSRP